MSASTAITWLTPGQEVVVIHGRNNMVSPVLTIDRVLKRDVVLSNGDRYSMTRLAPNGEHITKRGPDAWAPTRALFPADHPMVETYRQAEERRSVKSTCTSIAVQVADAIRSENWDEARRLGRKLADWLADAPDAPDNGSPGADR